MTGIDPPSMHEPSKLRRALLLGACVVGGLATGAAGWWLTVDSRWMLALPAAIAVGWLFVADPSRCEPPAGRRER